MLNKINTIHDLAPNAVPVSAFHKTNMNLLKHEMLNHIKTNFVQASFAVPISDKSMSFLSWLFSHADVQEVKYKEDSVEVVFQSVPWFADKVKRRIEQLNGVFNAIC